MRWSASIFMDTSINPGAQTAFPLMRWGLCLQLWKLRWGLWPFRSSREHVLTAVQLRQQQLSTLQVIIKLSVMQLTCFNLIHWYFQNRAFCDPGKLCELELPSQQMNNKYLRNSPGTDVQFPLAPRGWNHYPAWMQMDSSHLLYQHCLFPSSGSTCSFFLNLPR